MKMKKSLYSFVAFVLFVFFAAIAFYQYASGKISIAFGVVLALWAMYYGVRAAILSACEIYDAPEPAIGKKSVRSFVVFGLLSFFAAISFDQYVSGKISIAYGAILTLWAIYYGLRAAILSACAIYDAPPEPRKQSLPPFKR